MVSNFEVTVEKLIYGGDGLARLDGRVVFVPHVLPGERIRAQAERERPGLVRARALEVLDSAAERVMAPSEFRRLLRQDWPPPGVHFPQYAGAQHGRGHHPNHGRQLRPLNRLLSQMERILEINSLQEVTTAVVES